MAQVELLQHDEARESRAIDLRDAVVVKQQHLQVLERLEDDLIQQAEAIGRKVQVLHLCHRDKRLGGQESDAVAVEQQSVQPAEFDGGPLCTELGDGVEAEVQDGCVFWKSDGDVGQVGLGAAHDVAGAHAGLVAVQGACQELGTDSYCW